MDSHNNLLSFHDWAIETHSPCDDKRFFWFGFKGKTSLSTNFRIEVHLSVGINMDSRNNLLSFRYSAPETHSPYWDKWY